MRIAVVYPDLRRWPKMRWVACALRRLGHEVAYVQTIEKLAEFRGELVVFSQKGAGLNETDVVSLAAERTCPWVSWWFDLLAIEDKPLAEQSTMMTWTSQQVWEPTSDLKMMRALDLVLVKERSMLDEFRALGVNAEYMDQGCPQWLGECEHREVPEWDVLVYGTTCKDWRERRHDVTNLCAEGFAVAWAGHAAGRPPTACLPLPWCPPAGLPALASRAAVTLCCGLRNDVDGYVSDRFWIALGMGACVLARRWPGMPWREGAYSVYSSGEEIVSEVIRLRQDKGMRAAQGGAAREWVMEGRTIEHKCQELLAKVEKLCEPQARVHAENATAVG